LRKLGKIGNPPHAPPPGNHLRTIWFLQNDALAMQYATRTTHCEQRDTAAANPCQSVVKNPV